MTTGLKLTTNRDCGEQLGALSPAIGFHLSAQFFSLSVQIVDVFAPFFTKQKLSLESPRFSINRSFGRLRDARHNDLESVNRSLRLQQRSMLTEPSSEVAHEDVKAHERRWVIVRPDFVHSKRSVTPEIKESAERAKEEVKGELIYGKRRAQALMKIQTDAALEEVFRKHMSSVAVSINFHCLSTEIIAVKRGCSDGTGSGKFGDHETTKVRSAMSMLKVAEFVAGKNLNLDNDERGSEIVSALRIHCNPEEILKEIQSPKLNRDLGKTSQQARCNCYKSPSIGQKSKGVQFRRLNIIQMNLRLSVRGDKTHNVCFENGIDVISGSFNRSIVKIISKIQNVRTATVLRSRDRRRIPSEITVEENFWNVYSRAQGGSPWLSI
jgi:hypothetical protein